jgi:hypothetical protein
MSHHIASHPGAVSSGGREELVRQGRITPSNQGESALTQVPGGAVPPDPVARLSESGPPRATRLGESGYAAEPQRTRIRADLSPARSSGRSARRRCGVRLVLLVACAILCSAGIGAVAHGLLPDDCRPGIGDVERAKKKIKPGMTKDEVRALLGRPHRRFDGPEESAWSYWDTVFADSVLRIHFGPDGRVTNTESWAQ